MVSMVMLTFRLGVASLLLIATACSNEGSGDLPAAADLLFSLRAADSSVAAAIAARDPERTAAFYADSAVIMPVAEPIVEGRAAILEEWRHVFGIPGFANNSRLIAAVVSSGGDLGYTRGTYESLMLSPRGQKLVERGKWVTIWKRGADGSWRIVLDIFNTDTPPPEHQPSTAERSDH